MKNLIVSTLLFWSLGTCAQDHKASIKEDLSNYFNLLEEKKISEALDHVHPELMDMVGKETFMQQYGQLFSDPASEVSFKDFNIDSISSLHIYEEVKYAQVDYGYQLIFDVRGEEPRDTTMTQLLVYSFGGQFGKENVVADENGKITITAQKQLFAVMKEDFDGWKIVDYEKGMRFMLVAFIPEEVLKHFNK